MKKLFIALIGFACTMSYAQYNIDAPWAQEINRFESSNQFQSEVEAFNEYWKNHDPNQKGSGYKPFKRWQQHWQYALTPDGSISTPQNLWDQWEKKQKMQPTSGSPVTWTSVGPYAHTNTTSWSPGQGRVNVAVTDPSNPNIYYVGTPAGGIWKSSDRGLNWTPLSDYLPQIGVSGIAIDPKDSNTIYISTGDDDNSDSYSVGVMKSIDGGVTWSHTGLKFTSFYASSNDIFIHPTNSNILWVATDQGVYKTTNAGTTWSNTLVGNIKDIKIKPGDPNVVYAVTNNEFYKSINGGDSFTRIQSNLPLHSGRMTIDVTPANPNYVYVLSSKTDQSFQGLYKSTDSGVSFTKTLETANIFENKQAWYDMALAVSDTNPEIVFVGCLNVWKSTNGGDAFTKINHWSNHTQVTYTHADIHFLRYYNGKLFCGSDGGFYISENDGASFTDLTKGLQIGQFYRISVAENGSSDALVGGLQDNGGYARNGNTWNVYHGADGMDCAVDPANENRYFGFIQEGGSLHFTSDKGLTHEKTVYGPEKGEWITPLIASPDGNIYAGYSKFYKLNLTTNSFVKVSDFNFGGRLKHLEQDPNNVNVIYAATWRTLYKTTNQGVNWSLVRHFVNPISSIEVHNDNSNILYVTTGGSYNGGGVYMSVNRGTTFENINNNLPDEGKLVIKHQKGTQNIYVGTHLGVYLKEGDKNWVNYSSNLPNTSVKDLEVNLKDQVLIAATYGRGIWKVPLATSGIGDTIAPTSPTGLVASNITEASVVLSWEPSTDNVGVIGYDVYQDGVVVASVNGTTATIGNLLENTTYKFNVKAWDAAGNLSPFSDMIVVTTGSRLSYCRSYGNSTENEYISRVQLSGVNNESRGSVPGYEDYTSISTSLLKEKTYTISISQTSLGTQYLLGYTVWIDFNQDGDFEDNGEEVVRVWPTKNKTVSEVFTVPWGALLGKTRMRVSMKLAGFPKSCQQFSYGEVEDYSVEIIDNPNMRSGKTEVGRYGVNKELTIVPNPVKNGILKLKFSATKDARYEIVDLGGRVLVSGALVSDSISITQLKKGLYVLKVITEGQEYSERFVKD
ncbi:VPS10 domain-containing protein [Aquimarina sediminis]|uniref:VPS10 domain-containing protein n=1 Tax=Aquimarina sediminis TaxID=2070536 RepID=UPI000CA036E9|nr:GEVED domain-containing protein [Aquimarina sediminis]